MYRYNPLIFIFFFFCLSQGILAQNDEERNIETHPKFGVGITPLGIMSKTISSSIGIRYRFKHNMQIRFDVGKIFNSESISNGERSYTSSLLFKLQNASNFELIVGATMHKYFTAHAAIFERYDGAYLQEMDYKIRRERLQLILKIGKSAKLNESVSLHGSFGFGLGVLNNSYNKEMQDARLLNNFGSSTLSNRQGRFGSITLSMEIGADYFF